MCRLIESIKVENGKLCNIESHTKRFNEARREAFGVNEFLDLSQAIEIYSNLSNAIHKCRVLYSSQIEAVEFQEYTPKVVKTLKLVDGGAIDYHLKYENRESLNKLLLNKAEADDILIVKDGFITDTSYSNIAFFDGVQWYTPDTYLLNGTMRQTLLANGKLKEATVTPFDLAKYIEAKMINAMLDFEETACVEILK